MHHTEKEILELNQQNLTLLDQQLSRKKFSIEDVAELIPGMLHLNNLQDATPIFVDQYAQEFFELTVEQMVELKEKFLYDCHHSSTYTDLIPRLIDFGKLVDNNKTIGYFQSIKSQKEKTFENFIGFTKVSKELNCFISIENPISTFGDSTIKMNKLVDDNVFLRKNYRKFASLSKREIEIIKLIGIGKSRKEITCLLNISTHTHDNHRKNIRKKLEINNSIELYKYIRAFDLI